MAYMMFFLGRNIVSGPLCTLKPKKTKNLKNLKKQRNLKTLKT